MGVISNNICSLRGGVTDRGGAGRSASEGWNYVGPETSESQDPKEILAAVEERLAICSV